MSINVKHKYITLQYNLNTMKLCPNNQAFLFRNGFINAAVLLMLLTQTQCTRFDHSRTSRYWLLLSLQ